MITLFRKPVSHERFKATDIEVFLTKYEGSVQLTLSPNTGGGRTDFSIVIQDNSLVELITLCAQALSRGEKKDPSELTIPELLDLIRAKTNGGS